MLHRTALLLSMFFTRRTAVVISKLYKYRFSSHLHCDNTVPSSSLAIFLASCFVLVIHIYWKAFLCTHPSFFDGWRVRVGFLLARLISQMECQRCTGCIKSSRSRNTILRAKEHKEMWEAEAISWVLWFLRSKQSLKRQQLRPLLRTMTLFAQCAPILPILAHQCPGCLLLKNTFKCNLEQPFSLVRG